MKSNFERRVRFLYVILFLVALLCVGRLYFLQIVYGDTYREKANSEIFNGSPPIFSRGTIYYSGKNNELASAATLMSGHILSINPSLLPEANEVYEKLSAIVPLDKDIFLNVVGGVRLMDPAADLGVVVALASALLDKPVAFDTAILGEVGLSAEVRSVPQLAIRVQEARKLGFKRCIVPQNNLKMNKELDVRAIKIIGVETVKQALEQLTTYG